MRVLARPSTLAIVLLTAALVAAPLGLAQLPSDVSTPGVGSDTTGGVTGSVAGNNVSAGGDVSADVPGTTVDVPGVDQPVVAGIGWHAEYAFDLPLFDRGSHERFRLKDAAGHYHDTVNISITWRDSTGAVRDFPDQERPVILELVHADGRFEATRTHVQGGVAHFEAHHGDLNAGAHTAWYLRAFVPEEIPGGEVGVYSYYRSGNASETLAASAVADATDMIGSPVWLHDRDEDGHPDDRDNCPRHANPDQANMDGDLQGDVCDNDIDGDSWSNEAEENAGSDPRSFDSTPLDRDGDGHNNTAEQAAGSDPDDPASTPDDPDADGYNNTVEAAAPSDPHDPASTPLDRDADGLANESDNCPDHANPGQADGDSDGIGDACDQRLQDGPTGDADGDGLLNQDDNCPRHANADQANMDGDHRGDVCDSDRDGDGHVNSADRFPDNGLEWRDNDNDGLGDNADQDDDNDGLSDDAEAASGTDKDKSDTDGDRLSDLDELRLGSRPLDPYSPDYRPHDASATGQSDGSIVIEWTGTTDARIRGYLVWELGDVRLVGETSGTGDLRLVDRGHGGGDVLYGIQPMFHDEGLVFDPSRVAMVPIFAQDVLAWEYEEAPDILPEAQSDPGTTSPAPTPAPGKDSPAPAWLLLAGIAVAVITRRPRA